MGYWDVPGGFCEVDEHPILAGERETYEETGVRIRVTGYVGMWFTKYRDPHPTSELDTFSLGIFYHAVSIEEGSPPSDTETADVRWFAFDEIPKDLAFPDQQPAAIAAWKQAVKEGRTTTPLPDYPGNAESEYVAPDGQRLPWRRSQRIPIPSPPRSSHERASLRLSAATLEG